MTWPTLGLQVVEAISPSRFKHMQDCPLREVWAANRVAGLLPSSPSQFVGSIIHQVFEAVALDAAHGDVGQAFDDIAARTDESLLLDAVNRRWVPLSVNAPNYSEMRRRAIDRAPTVKKAAPGVGGHNRRRSGPEVRVFARGGRIRGLIDEVDLSDGRVVLRDLKTGTVKRSGTSMPEAKEEYAAQLRLYAAMYAEDTAISGGRWPDALELVPLFGPPLVVPFEPDECEVLLDEAVATLAAINEIVELQEDRQAEQLLARPSPDNCRWCPYRPACVAYRSAADVSDNSWPPDIWGVVGDKALKGNGTVSVSVLSGRELYRVRNIQQPNGGHPLIDDLQLEDSVAVFGLQRSRTRRTFVAGAFTVILLLD